MAPVFGGCLLSATQTFCSFSACLAGLIFAGAGVRPLLSSSLLSKGNRPVIRIPTASHNRVPEDNSGTGG